ncbi:hypothetical protein GDO86_000302 [Hymenochirus boettgeri]|uniref:LIM and calponin homology domains 1 n=1 Tax=Hymenochirus boettgeri TaxID=247094 RepID=A0A8T2KAH0_9PIPI|nr:hypothetical protein GDO86_000302 [Hymenochirus boettgeri]
MASSAALQGEEVPPQPQESPPDTACREAQQWIEQVTGRSFGEKDFRTGLENGILLCELLNAIKPGIVRKINRLPTPIAGLDNITLFLRGCKELGLKDSQLFDPGDLQDATNRTTGRTSDYYRKLRNVLVTVYWLGKAANSCASYCGSNLDLKEFEGLLAQMRKENEDTESPKHSIRDSGYIDCWDSERSDSLSPPRHGRDDSFDSLDSFGSRSQQTPSPDVILRGSSDGRGSDSESDLPHRRIPDVRKDDMSARRISYGENKVFVPFNQYLPNKSNQTAYIPAPLRKKKAEREDYRKSWSTATSPLGGERPFRSMSMCDMRYEEEGSVLPHSRAHHDHLQQINDLLKEEDDTWQDDLARWKTRRRSASHDLIKKEQERKKMERMLSGESDLSQRRKSIKTYKEIVEEKELREKELHEDYKNAKTKQEADKILEKYIEKFTISEAVLEQLVMPKILERSHSVEPSLLSSSEDSNPLKYLRQNSLPSPKYTATVEATVSPTSTMDLKSPTGLISPSKNVISKTVPMLTAKPYSQPKNTQDVLKTFKVDGKVNINGEQFNGTEDRKEAECCSQVFTPSLTRSQIFEGVARIDSSAIKVKRETEGVNSSSSRQETQNSLKQYQNLSEDSNHKCHKDEHDSTVQTEYVHSEQQSPHGDEKSDNISQVVPAVTSLEFIPASPKEFVVNGKDSEGKRKVEASQLVMHWSLDSMYKESKEIVSSECVQEVCQERENKSSKYVQLNITLQIRNAWRRSQFFLQPVDVEKREESSALVPSVNFPNRFCPWDPEEERKRQEKWQQEQEKLLQEKYQKEQEKLKEEWEKAQKEVEEEERKYYEEERKIIEDTLVPLTLSSNSNGHFSISERNGNFIPALTEHSKGDQENNNNRKLMTESHIPLMDDAYSKGRMMQQPVLWAEEETHCTTEEEQIKGRLRIDSKGGTGHSPQSSQCQPSNRSVSGKKLCSTCGNPLGKGAAMIIETLSLYFHIQCFKCGICKGQLGDATNGTDVRIRNGLLNCNDCYVKSRTAGHPTPL